MSVGATGIWVMHFIAMLGFTIPGQQIRYNVPVTIGSMLIAVAVVGVGLFIVGYSRAGVVPLLAGGVIIGIGVATMHYTGMAAMRVDPGTMPATSGATAVSFLLPLLLGVSLVTVVLTLLIALSPTEEEIHEDTRLRSRLKDQAR